MCVRLRELAKCLYHPRVNVGNPRDIYIHSRPHKVTNIAKPHSLIWTHIPKLLTSFGTRESVHRVSYSYSRSNNFTQFFSRHRRQFAVPRCQRQPWLKAAQQRATTVADATMSKIEFQRKSRIKTTGHIYSRENHGRSKHFHRRLRKRKVCTNHGRIGFPFLLQFNEGVACTSCIYSHDSDAMAPSKEPRARRMINCDDEI